MIHMKNVQVVKSGQKLFQYLNWKIESGENWVVDGKNGSGKTTLLELLAGLIHASHGEVAYDFVEGNTWEELYWDKKKKIKLIPTHAIHSLFSGNNELYYQQRYYAATGETRRVRDFFGDGIHKIHELEIPSSLAIDTLLDREITRLSNGQLKKILLIQSLLHEMPRMLLLDYPFEGLDRKSREDLSRFIDFISVEYNIQIILADHHHHIPAVMNRRLTLDNFKIAEQSVIQVHHVTGVPKNKMPFESTLQDRQPVVEIKNLTIQYGDTVILDKFNWTIRYGDRWALLGRNGSGKTTLFSLIFADHPMAYSQEIYLFGKRRGTGESIWDIKKRINYLGPELVSYLHPKAIHISGYDYIRSLHKTFMIAKFETLVQYFDAAAWLEKPVRFFSSGQLQLMLIISCFLEEKEMLLLDEPFQFLDPLHKKLVSEYLQLHLDKNSTLILITHYEEDIVNWTEKTMEI